jgi:hypothetical protein
MKLNYKKIIIDGYDYVIQMNNAYQKNLLVAHFKQEAQIAKRDFMEFATFFYGCKVEIKDCKRYIERQYQKALADSKSLLDKFLALGIQDSIKYYRNEIESIKKRGYKNNNDYVCRYSSNGIIGHLNVSDMITRYNCKDRWRNLYYSDLIFFENAIIQAEQELILRTLEQNELITQNPLQWIGQKNLCAYFVDNYFKSQPNKWKIGEKLFNVNNLKQAKYDYSKNKKTNGKPKGYQIIDTILPINIY